MRNVEGERGNNRSVQFRILHSAFRISNAGVAQQRQQQFRKLPGNPPPESASLSAGPKTMSEG